MRSNSFESQIDQEKIGITKINKPNHISSNLASLQKNLMKSYEKLEAFLRQNCSQSGRVISKYIKNNIDPSLRKLINNEKVSPVWMLKHTEETIKNRLKYQTQRRKVLRFKDRIILASLISLYSDAVQKETSQFEGEDWNQISKMMPGFDSETLMIKWIELNSSSETMKNIWTEKEEQLLCALINQHGTNNWCLISKQLYQQNPDPSKFFRTWKRVKEHWNIVVNPAIKKQPWTLKEDYQLLKGLQSSGEKWIELSKTFEGRNSQSIRRRYYQLRKINCHLLEGLNQKESIGVLLMKTNEDLQTEMCRAMMASLQLSLPQQSPMPQECLLALQPLIPQQDIPSDPKKVSPPHRQAGGGAYNLRSKQQQLKQRKERNQQEQIQVFMIQQEEEEQQEESIFNEQQSDNIGHLYGRPLEVIELPSQPFDEELQNFINSPIIQTEQYQFMVGEDDVSMGEKPQKMEIQNEND